MGLCKARPAQKHMLYDFVRCVGISILNRRGSPSVRDRSNLCTSFRAAVHHVIIQV